MNGPHSKYSRISSFSLTILLISISYSCRSREGATKPQSIIKQDQQVENPWSDKVVASDVLPTTPNLNAIINASPTEKLVWLHTDKPDPGLVYYFRICPEKKLNTDCIKKISITGSALFPPLQANSIAQLRACLPKNQPRSNLICSKVSSLKLKIAKNQTTDALSREHWNQIDTLSNQLNQKIERLFEKQNKRFEQEYKETIDQKVLGEPGQGSLGVEQFNRLMNAYLLTHQLPEQSTKQDSKKKNCNQDATKENTCSYTEKFYRVPNVMVISLASIGLASLAFGSAALLAGANFQKQLQPIQSMLKTEAKKRNIPIDKGEIQPEQAKKVISEIIEELRSGVHNWTSFSEQKLEQLYFLSQFSTEWANPRLSDIKKTLDQAELFLIAQGNSSIKTTAPQYFTEYAKHWGVRQAELNQDLFRKFLVDGQLPSTEQKSLIIRYDTDPAQSNQLKDYFAKENLYTTRKSRLALDSSEKKVFHQFVQAVEVRDPITLKEISDSNKYKFKKIQLPDGNSIETLKGNTAGLESLPRRFPAVYFRKNNVYYQAKSWVEVEKNSTLDFEKHFVYLGDSPAPQFRYDRRPVLSKETIKNLEQAHHKAVISYKDSVLRNIEIAKSKRPQGAELKSDEIEKILKQAYQDHIHNWGKGIRLEALQYRFSEPEFDRTSGEIIEKSNAIKVLMQPPSAWRTENNWNEALSYETTIKQDNIPTYFHEYLSEDRRVLTDKNNFLSSEQSNGWKYWVRDRWSEISSKAGVGKGFSFILAHNPQSPVHYTQSWINLAQAQKNRKLIDQTMNKIDIFVGNTSNIRGGKQANFAADGEEVTAGIDQINNYLKNKLQTTRHNIDNLTDQTLIPKASTAAEISTRLQMKVKNRIQAAGVIGIVTGTTLLSAAVLFQPSNNDKTTNSLNLNNTPPSNTDLELQILEIYQKRFQLLRLVLALPEKQAPPIWLLDF